MNNNTLTLKEYAERIDKRLDELVCAHNEPYKNCLYAMKHSLSAGGKRIRPVLALEFYRVCGGTNDILSVACAIEMIHTFSLIHDDLPCMDNDDYRRGKPSCHKAYGEAVALLAGDALATLPYEIITSDAINGNITADSALKVINELSKAVGTDGMIGGQIIDIENEGRKLDEKTLVLLDTLKTGALIKVSCKAGCILAGADDKHISLACQYAEKIGVAFQIIDDILDVTSTFEKLGKPINSDNENNKSTYVTIYGLDKAKEMARELTDEALAILDNFNNNEFLVELTKQLLNREN